MGDVYALMAMGMVIGGAYLVFGTMGAGIAMLVFGIVLVLGIMAGGASS